MARVEIPAPGDLIMDGAGNVVSNVTVSLKLAGTGTDVTHYSALTGGTSTTGGLKSGSDGTIVDGSGNRRYVDSGIAMDLTIDGRTRQIEPLSAGSVIQTTAVADSSTQVGVGVFENTADDWYGRWITEGNSPNSMGFSGTPSTTPATTTTSGVTFPLSNATIAVADTAQLNANGGSFTLGGKRVVYTGRSTSSGAGNATGCYSLSTASGTVTSGTSLGNTAKAWAPRVMYHQFGRDGKPLTGSVQLFAGIAASLVPSMDDSFEGGSFLAIMQDGGSTQTQHQPVTGGEFTAQLINNWQMPDGYTAPLVAGGSRTSVGGNSFAKNVIGWKITPQFVGYQEQYDGLYQTVTALDTWGQVDGSGSPITLPLATITFKGASKRPPTPPAGGSVVVRLGANAQGVGGQLVTYTGVTGSGTTGTLTGCTGGTGNIADSSNIVNSARSINVVDVIQGQAGIQFGASAWSASIIAALKGGTDSISSMLAITGPTNAEVTGGLTQLRLGAGSGQTKSVMQMFDTAGTNRLSISAAGTMLINGASVVMQSGGTNNVVIGNNDGYVQPGTSTARGGGTALGAKINSGTNAPSYAATVGDLFFRTDTPSTANQRLYICTVAAGTWVGIV